MSTLSNPSCVSGSPLNPVEQLLRRSAEMPELEPAAPVNIGQQSESDVLRVDSKRHTWPVFLTTVPADWEPDSWRTIPPNTQRFKKAGVASKVGAVLNQELINSSSDGTVKRWFIRVKFNGKFGLVNIPVQGTWRPSGPYDMPPAFIRIDGPSEECKRVVGELNSEFFGNPETRNRRAYIGRSISPENLQASQPVEESDQLKQRLQEISRLAGDIQ